MANGSHGSLERMPGALFRAMGALVLQKKGCDREALAHELKEHLENARRRVPRPNAQAAADGKRVVGPSRGPGSDAARPLARERPTHRPRHREGTRRRRPVGRPGEIVSRSGSPANESSRWPSSGCSSTRRSRRGLACCSRSGLPVGAFISRSIRFRTSWRGDSRSLAVRSTKRCSLFFRRTGLPQKTRLALAGSEHQKDIAAYLQDRALESADRLMDLARAWKLRNHQPSSRHLAVILQQKLRRRGLDLGLGRIQKAVDGRVKHVRHALIVEMEGVLRESPPRRVTTWRARWRPPRKSRRGRSISAG